MNVNCEMFKHFLFVCFVSVSRPERFCSVIHMLQVDPGYVSEATEFPFTDNKVLSYFTLKSVTGAFSYKIPDLFFF